MTNHRIHTRGNAYKAIRGNPSGVAEHNRKQDDLKHKALEAKKGETKKLKKELHNTNPAALDSRMKNYKNNKY